MVMNIPPFEAESIVVDRVGSVLVPNDIQIHESMRDYYQDKINIGRGFIIAKKLGLSITIHVECTTAFQHTVYLQLLDSNGKRIWDKKMDLRYSDREEVTYEFERILHETVNNHLDEIFERGLDSLNDLPDQYGQW